MNKKTDAVPARIPFIESVKELRDRYDVWLCDIWGVIHNGIAKNDSAVEACRTFRSAGGVVILITNAPRPKSAIYPQFEAMNIPDDCYDEIVTSGDVTRNLLSQYSGKNVYHLGPERDLPIFHGIDVNLTPLKQADVILCSGLFDDDTETPEDYRAQFTEIMGLGLPMICANPDLVVERGDRIVYCGGALAQLYEELGGTVALAGKPHAPIYERSLSLAGQSLDKEVRQDRVLAIGDGLKTDLAGAHNAGLDALFIISAIHFDLSNENELGPSIDAIFSESEARPVAVQRRLNW